MTISKPPTSKKPVTLEVGKVMRFKLVVPKVGCWGLPVVCFVVLYCISICCDVSTAAAARVPASAVSPGISSQSSANTIKKRNANFHQQIALIRNATVASIAMSPTTEMAQPSQTPRAILSSVQPPLVLVPAASSSLHENISSFLNLNSSAKSASKVDIDNKNASVSLNTAPTSAAERIGQALLDSNYLLNDITQCGSEDCFETGMQITESVPPPSPPTPTMRQQIADAILVSDFRNGREAIMHPRNIQPITGTSAFDKRQFESADYWRSSAFDSLHKKLMQRPIESVAKNIILFLGDGMSVPTVTAARILKGQQVDHIQFGEEGELHMDTFPYSGVSKTFCSDAQVADSACTATAYLCGVKANTGTIGLTPDVTKNNCTAQNEPAYRLSSILAWAQAAGKSTGIVTTARVTHASPAGTYAKIANRNWENDHEVRRDGVNSEECDDIAEQLVLREPGRNINVILGGGRLQFLPRTKTDPENGRRGLRTDGQNLVEAWKRARFDTSRYAYVEGKRQLSQVDPSSVDYLLGLFAPSHMEYFHEQDKHDDPTLAEMTQMALQILGRNPNGFFLFVEGGRIDHAHHNNQGLRAIWETVEMDRAIKLADEMTHDQDTLLLVTADHSHVFSLAGYPPRGNPIAGIAEIALDDMPYTTLTYANGPAYKSFVNNQRYNISNDPLDDLKYKQIPNIPRKSETHGGDDVPMYAKGPFSHLFTGVQQQSYIPHALAYAACIGPGPKFCDHSFY